MSRITIYTDIDTLFDTRRGILEHLLKKNGHSWEELSEIYNTRRMDYFDVPHLGFNHNQYLERFSQRDTDDWVEGDVCYFLPTKIIGDMLPIIRSIEFGALKTIMVAKIELTINMYPFDMSETLQTSLIAHLKTNFKIPIDIKLVNVNFDSQTANYINGHDYVFRYGHLINPEFKTWFETFATSNRAGAKIIVPELLARDFDNDSDLDPLREESIKILIEKASAVQGGKCVFIPLDKTLFDHI